MVFHNSLPNMRILVTVKAFTVFRHLEVKTSRVLLINVLVALSTPVAVVTALSGDSQGHVL